MSGKRFESEKAENCEYDYSTLDTYYELKNERIIEWNKHSSNVEYFDFENIVKLLNIKQMKLENCQKNNNKISELYKVNEQLQQEREYYRKYALYYLEEFPLYSDDFIETMRSIEGEEFANKMLKDQNEIIKALKREGLWNE